VKAWKLINALTDQVVVRSNYGDRIGTVGELVCCK
jgi:hypothetical protein